MTGSPALRNRQRKWARAWRTAQRAAGLCLCGRTPKPGGKLCVRCLEYASVYKKRRRARAKCAAPAMSDAERAYTNAQLQPYSQGKE